MERAELRSQSLLADLQSRVDIANLTLQLHCLHLDPLCCVLLQSLVKNILCLIESSKLPEQLLQGYDNIFGLVVLFETFSEHAEGLLRLTHFLP